MQKFMQDHEQETFNKYYSEEQFKELLQHAPTESNYDIAMMLGYHAGLRLSEACALTWNHVNFRDQLLTIDQKLIFHNGDWDYKKLSNPRTVVINDYLILKLVKHRTFQALATVNKERQHLNWNVVTSANGDLFNFPDAIFANHKLTQSSGEEFFFHNLRNSYLLNEIYVSDETDEFLEDLELKGAV